MISSLHYCRFLEMSHCDFPRRNRISELVELVNGSFIFFNMNRLKETLKLGTWTRYKPYLEQSSAFSSGLQSQYDLDDNFTHFVTV